MGGLCPNRTQSRLDCDLFDEQYLLKKDFVAWNLLFRKIYFKNILGIYLSYLLEYSLRL